MFFISPEDLDHFSMFDRHKVSNSTLVIRAGYNSRTAGLWLLSYHEQSRQVASRGAEVLEEFQNKGIAKLMMYEVFQFAASKSDSKKRSQILFPGFTGPGEKYIARVVGRVMKDYPNVDVYSL